MKIISKTFKFPKHIETETIDKETNTFFENLIEKYPSFNFKTDIKTDQLVFDDTEIWRTILIQIF